MYSTSKVWLVLYAWFSLSTWTQMSNSIIFHIRCCLRSSLAPPLIMRWISHAWMCTDEDRCGCLVKHYVLTSGRYRTIWWMTCRCGHQYRLSGYFYAICLSVLVMSVYRIFTCIRHLPLWWTKMLLLPKCCWYFTTCLVFCYETILPSLS